MNLNIWGLSQAVTSTISKFDIDSILDVLIEKIPSSSDIWIAGGSALFYIGGHPTTPEDIDIFFETPDSFNECLDYFNSKYRINYQSEDAISYTVGGKRIQLIQRTFKPIEEILSEFDFRNVMVSVNCKTREVLDYRQGAGKTIAVNKYENSSFFRLIKYSKYGFKVPEEIIRQYIEGHINGKIKPLYKDSISNSREEFIRYASMAIQPENKEMTRILLESFPEELWLEEALFSNNRNFLRILSEENKNLAVSRFQELAFEVNLGNYKKYQEEIRDLYPEYFIQGRVVYYELELSDLWF